MKLYWLLYNFFAFLLPGKTIGARALVIKDNQVLLVKHTYMPDQQWYTIGGAVEKGEPPEDAINRELQEEAGITLLSRPKILNVYYNLFRNKDNYVVLYVCHDFTESDHICTNEIAEKRWFPLDNLPSDTSPATRRRIEEYMGMRELANKW